MSDPTSIPRNLEPPPRRGLIRRARAALPIRQRIALGSGLLGLIVLGIFGIAVGLLTASTLRDNFHQDVHRGAAAVAHYIGQQRGAQLSQTCATLVTVMADDDADARVFDGSGAVRCVTAKGLQRFGPPSTTPREVNGYYVQTTSISSSPPLQLQYGRPTAPVEENISDINRILLLSVIAGTVLIYLISLVIARIALRPIADLTAAAKEIEERVDNVKGSAVPEFGGEVGELSTTLNAMLKRLEGSRTRTAGLLKRQREFLAEASHELGTPLTSLLANLEFIIDQLEGEHGEAGQAALRSALRLKTLVSDLMLLARTDAERKIGSERVDLAVVVTEAVSEIKPLREEHHIELQLERAIVEGSADDLHRMILNLLANAVRHTPAGTRVEVTTTVKNGHAVVVVEDNGPGIPEAIAPKVFDRFVKGRSSRKGSSGLGLAIVRAVAETHSGSVRLEKSKKGTGARFVIEIPTALEPQ